MLVVVVWLGRLEGGGVVGIETSRKNTRLVIISCQGFVLRTGLFYTGLPLAVYLSGIAILKALDTIIKIIVSINTYTVTSNGELLIV